MQLRKTNELLLN